MCLYSTVAVELSERDHGLLDRFQITATLQGRSLGIKVSKGSYLKIPCDCDRQGFIFIDTLS